MNTPHPPHRRCVAVSRALRSALVLVTSMALSGCDGGPTAAEVDPDFPVWHQDFESGTAGWYGADTEGELGWCGSIGRTADEGGVDPSAGAGFATLRGGPCNSFWGERGVPYGVPYAPGPGYSLYSDTWPRSGFVTELDVFLDPAWAAEFAGNFVPDALIQYGTTVFPLDRAPGDFHTGPHWFVPVSRTEDRGGLSVLGRPVDEAGWYTFRFLYRGQGGDVRVDFELEDESGTTVVSETALAPWELQGPELAPWTAPVRTAEYGSGHVWFLDLAPGLALPVDEHRMQPGA